MPVAALPDGSKGCSPSCPSRASPQELSDLGVLQPGAGAQAGSASAPRDLGEGVLVPGTRL